MTRSHREGYVSELFPGIVFSLPRGGVELLRGRRAGKTYRALAKDAGVTPGRMSQKAHYVERVLRYELRKPELRPLLSSDPDSLDEAFLNSLHPLS